MCSTWVANVCTQSRRARTSKDSTPNARPCASKAECGVLWRGDRGCQVQCSAAQRAFSSFPDRGKGDTKQMDKDKSCTDYCAQCKASVVPLSALDEMRFPTHSPGNNSVVIVAAVLGVDGPCEKYVRNGDKYVLNVVLCIADESRPFGMEICIWGAQCLKFGLLKYRDVVRIRNADVKVSSSNTYANSRVTSLRFTQFTTIDLLHHLHCNCTTCLRAARLRKWIEFALPDVRVKRDVNMEIRQRQTEKRNDGHKRKLESERDGNETNGNVRVLHARLRDLRVPLAKHVARRKKKGTRTTGMESLQRIAHALSTGVSEVCKVCARGRGQCKCIGADLDVSSCASAALNRCSSSAWKSLWKYEFGEILLTVVPVASGHDHKGLQKDMLGAAARARAAVVCGADAARLLGGMSAERVKNLEKDGLRAARVLRALARDTERSFEIGVENAPDERGRLRLRYVRL